MRSSMIVTEPRSGSTETLETQRVPGGEKTAIEKESTSPLLRIRNSQPTGATHGYDVEVISVMNLGQQSVLIHEDFTIEAKVRNNGPQASPN